MVELSWDDRFGKTMSVVKGPPDTVVIHPSTAGAILSRLGVSDTVAMTAFIHARGCDTLSEFLQRSNYTKILVNMDGANVPVIVRFCDALPL